jgi:DNA mismatch repair protein MutS2
LGEDFDIMVITGPNTGGKTATLKTVGLLALMAQSGLPIPAAEGSTMPVLDGIWIDVGDEQSLEQSLSTFSAHLARILDILKRAQRQTLVLFDELGAGTDPDEGAAIGRAIVDHLMTSGCLAMVTTHLGALKAIAYQAKRVDNASVQFDLETLRPTYELRLGEPGNSNAIAIASRLGMPKILVQAARKHLAGQHRALDRAISGTLRTRREAERARHDADLARQEAARATLAALDKAKALEQRQQAYAAWVEKVMRMQPGDEVFVKKFDKTGRIVRVRFEKQQASIDLGAMEVDVALSEIVFKT